MSIFFRRLCTIIIFILLYLPFDFNPQASASQEPSFLANMGLCRQKIGGLLQLQMRLKNQYVKTHDVRLLPIMQKNGMDTDNVHSQKIFIYYPCKPSAQEIKSLRKTGVTVFGQSWIPPLPNHPDGFMLGIARLEAIPLLTRRARISRITTAERVLFPLLDIATGTSYGIGAAEVWAMGSQGSGVNIAILDSGLDLSHPDLPPVEDIQKKDYSKYPALDDTVENTLTIHGTHVTGSALGRGTMSSGKYRGSAPLANLIFLKIGLDADASAEAPAITGALKDAVDLYAADIINVSYGSYSTFHDGSEAFSQAADYAASRGAIVFMAAGNGGADNTHYSGTAPAGGATEYIQVNAAGIPSSNSYALLYNLVWFDGQDNSIDLEMEFYDSTFNALPTDSSSQLESPRGTESQYFYWGNGDSHHMLPAGSSTYFLKVINNSAQDQQFHIYYSYAYNTETDNKVTFEQADPHYTIVSPAEADGVIAVGAYTSREGWRNYQGKQYSFAMPGSVGALSMFSSRGPRIDKEIKPEIAAPGSAIISLNDLTVDSPDMLVIDSARYYAVSQGTSMASPIAAGAAALMLEKNPYLSPLELKEIIESETTTDAYTGSTPNGQWGYGKLNIWQAFNALDEIETGSVSGTVIDTNTNDPLQGTVITVLPGEITKITDLSGNYFFSGLQQGAYTIAAEHADYESITKQLTVTPGTVVTVDFSLSPRPRNTPPAPPKSPSPASGEDGTALMITLQWKGGEDPDKDDSVVFDVYFGQPSDIALIVSDTVEKSVVLQQPLEYGIRYIWQVIAKDKTGAKTEGPLWGFTTAPGDIYGSIVDGKTDTAIKGATFILWGGSPLIVKKTLSDTDGNFSFQHLESSGLFHLIAGTINYWCNTASISFDGENPAHLFSLKLRPKTLTH